MYFPVEEAARKDAVLKSHKPVVVFIYGGSWGSGDKSMYGLLASQLADNLSAVVVCPNYSIYPKVFIMFVKSATFSFMMLHFNVTFSLCDYSLAPIQTVH